MLAGPLIKSDNESPTWQARLSLVVTKKVRCETIVFDMKIVVQFCGQNDFGGKGVHVCSMILSWKERA